MTILLLEDDVVLGRSLANALELAGFAVHVVSDGAAALSHLRDEQPELVMVELMLPTLDGLSVCRRIRARSDVPLILLAPQSSDTNQIAALELGADDYIVKPVSESVVLARVRALLRRKQAAPARHEREILRRGGLVVDVAGRRVWRDQQEVILNVKEFDLLICLIRHEGAVLEYDALQKQVGFKDDSRTLFVYMRKLREKVERDPSHPEYLLTVPHLGYRFQVPPAAYRQTLPD